MRLTLRTVCGLAVLALAGPAPCVAQLQLGTPGEKSLRVSGRIQTRYTGLDQSEAAENSFQIRRMRLKFDGDAHADIRYEILFGATAGSAFGPDRVQLLDANVSLRLADEVRLKVGQFKAPFGREFLTSSGLLLAPERSQLEGLVPNRQIGVQLGSTADATELAQGRKGRRFEYGFGAFNGNGLNQGRNDNTDLMLVGRAVVRAGDGWSVGGGAFTSRDSARVAQDSVGLAVAGRRTGVAADARLSSGRLLLEAELAQVQFDPEDGGAERTLRGFFAHAGLNLVPNELDAYVRYDRFDPDSDSQDNSDKRWIHVGLSHYRKGHDVKLQVEYVLKQEDGVAIDDDLIRAQLQVAW